MGDGNHDGYRAEQADPWARGVAMMDLGVNKSILRERLRRVEGLLQTLPTDAHGVHGLAADLVSDIHSRLGPWVLRVGTRERDALVERADAWCSLGSALLASRESAERLLLGEDAVEADCRRLMDVGTAAWFARRCESRKGFFSRVGLDIRDLDALNHARIGVERLAQVQAQDRRRIDLLAEAEQRLGRVRAAGETAPVAAGLEALKQILRAPGREPGPEWADRLELLLEPLRKFETRDQPPALDELRGLLHRMDDWLQVLDRGDGDGMHARMADRLRQLTKQAFAYMEDWRSQTDERARPMLEAAQGLEQELVTRAQALRDGLTRRLGLGRSIFRQFADHARSPRLDETLTRLIGETPDSPKALRIWRDAAYRALDAFEAAIGGYRPQIERHRDQLAGEATQLLDGISTLALDESDRTRLLALRQRLGSLAKAPASELATTELIASLQGLSDLLEQARALDHSATEGLRSASTEVEHLDQRMQRLARLAGALDQPLPEGMDTRLETDTTGAGDLATLRRRLAGMREQAATIEGDLLGRCWGVLGRDLAHLAEIQALLDPDLVPAHLPAAPAGHGLDEAEALLPLLPAARKALEGSLARQLERLHRRRNALLDDPAARHERPGAEGDSIGEALDRLRTWREDPHQPILMRAQGLRHLVTRVERQLARLEGRRRDLAERRALLAGRLAVLQQELFELESQRHMLDRVWATIQRVPGVVTTDDQVADQLAMADQWLGALERHADSCAGARLREHLETLGQVAPQAASALRSDLGDDQRRRPDFELRDRARRLAQRHLDE